MMDIKIVKKEGKNKGNEKQEITIEITGRITVYGGENLDAFGDELRILIDTFAI